MNKFNIGDKVKFKTTGEITVIKNLYYDEIRKKYCYVTKLKDYIIYIEDDFDFVSEEDDVDAKKYYIGKDITKCYPYKISEKIKVEDYGVLSEYIGNLYTRKEMDRIICEMITKHPYIEGSMGISISIYREDEEYYSFYHTLDFKNYNCDNQSKGNNKIMYEL